MKHASVLFASVLLAAIGFSLIAATPEKSKSTNNVVEAARLNNLGVAYMNQQLFEKALKSFEDAAKTDPALDIAKLNQAIALANLGKIDAALPVLQSAVKRNANDPYAWYNLGLAYKSSSNVEGAIGAFKHVTEIDPDDPNAW